VQKQARIAIATPSTLGAERASTRTATFRASSPRMALAGQIMTNLDWFSVGTMVLVLTGAVLFTLLVVGLMRD
jgi:hypothetical protein